MDINSRALIKLRNSKTVLWQNRIAVKSERRVQLKVYAEWQFIV